MLGSGEMTEGMRVKQVIVVRKDLNMRKGKIAAQVAHASMGAILSFRDSFDGDTVVLRPTEEALYWLDTSFTKICVYVNSEEELVRLHERARAAGVVSCLITDNGLTEFNGVPTKTCGAIGPALVKDVDGITGGLPLL